jgi:hypothetical protein
VYVNDDAAPRLIYAHMHRNRDGSSSVLPSGPSTVASSISDLPPRTPNGHLTETKTTADILHNHEGLDNWFLTGDTNNPDSIEPVEQIGWFQVLKGYIPKEWTL